MALYIRKFTRSKWTKNLNIEKNQYSADAITGCIRTQGETLSVWRTDNDDLTSEYNKKIIAALATSMDNPTAMDILMFDDDGLKEHDLQIVQEDSDSIVYEVNSSHYNISCLNYEKLGDVSDYIVSLLNAEKVPERIGLGKIKEIVNEMIQAGFISSKSLNVKWKKALNIEQGL